jgi:hypothetical protein
VQAPDDPVDEAVARVEFELPREPIGDRAEIRVAVREEVDAGREEQETPDDTLGRDQADEARVLQAVAPIAASV